MKTEPRNWFITDRIAEIRTALLGLEWEMIGAHFVGDRAEEMMGLARRLERLAAPRTAATVEPSPTAADRTVPVPPITGLSNAA